MKLAEVIVARAKKGASWCCFSARRFNRIYSRDDSTYSTVKWYFTTYKTQLNELTISEKIITDLVRFI